MALQLLLCGLLVTATYLVASAPRKRGGASREHALEERVARLSRDLEASQRLLSQTDRLSAVGLLAAGVAHEVRNPLVSVRTFVQLLPERLDDEEFRTGFRDLALAEIDRICVLVNDLLAFARPSDKEVRATDINAVLAQIQRLLHPEARKAGVDLAIELAPSVPALPVDEARVKQVLLNLALNAIQASSAGGRVVISTSCLAKDDTELLQIEVRDWGHGIAAADLDLIFDPFFTTKERGSGLGLFIAQRIVSEHGGHMDVRSTPDVGTVFVLNFPLPGLESARTAETPPAGKDAYDSSNRPVLCG